MACESLQHYWRHYWHCCTGFVSFLWTSERWTDKTQIYLKILDLVHFPSFVFTVLLHSITDGLNQTLHTSVQECVLSFSYSASTALLRHHFHSCHNCWHLLCVRSVSTAFRASVSYLMWAAGRSGRGGWQGMKEMFQRRIPEKDEGGCYRNNGSRVRKEMCMHSL